MIDFRRIIPPTTDLEIIAKRFSIRELERLRRDYGGRNWRKLKAKANVELLDGSIRFAKIHWYECHGIGKRDQNVIRLKI